MEDPRLKDIIETYKEGEKYDVVIIGCNMGGIFSRQFDKVKSLIIYRNR